jgi:hypothetical protein
MDWSDWDCTRYPAPAVDLGGVSLTEELAWFARTFEVQLATLVRHYRKPFQARWGVLAYRT